MRASSSQLTERLFRVEQQRRALVSEALFEHRLNLSQWTALSILARDGACSMTQLAEASAVDRTSLTRTIDGLIVRALVVRYTPPRDRRTVKVETTPDGLHLAQVLGEAIDAVELRWLAVLDERAQARMVVDLEALLIGASGGDAPEVG